MWGLETKDRSPNVSAVERLNMYLAPIPGGGRGDLALYGMPGARLWVDLGPNPVKGWCVSGEYLYAVAGMDLIRIAKDATFEVVETVSNSFGSVDMADNGDQVIIVAGGDAEIYSISGDSISTVSGFPGYASVAYQGGRFLSEEQGDKLWASAYGDGETWGGTTFASAEAASDHILRVFVFNNIVMVFGERTVEFWQNVGTTPFPYGPVGPAPEAGLVAFGSVAAGSDGVYALMRDALNRISVFKVTPYAAVSVTDAPQSAIFESFLTVSDAIGFTFQAAGHEFYQITFPTANETWILDASVGAWTRGIDVNDNALGGRIAITLGNHRLIASATDGKIYTPDLDTPTWMGALTPKGVVSRVGTVNNTQVRCYSAELEAEMGVGVSGGGSPVVMMDISKDGGHTYGNERWRDLGAQGDRKKRLVWYSNGLSRQFTFRFRVTDPATRVVFMSGILDLDIAA